MNHSATSPEALVPDLVPPTFADRPIVVEEALHHPQLIAGREQTQRAGDSACPGAADGAAVGGAHLRRHLHRAGQALGEAQPALAPSRRRLQKQLLLICQQGPVSALESDPRRRRPGLRHQQADRGRAELDHDSSAMVGS